MEKTRFKLNICGVDVTVSGDVDRDGAEAIAERVRVRMEEVLNNAYGATIEKAAVIAAMNLSEELSRTEAALNQAREEADALRTKTKEFANDVLATTDLPVLLSYKEKIAKGLAAKAAGYATVGREIVKRDMESIFNGKIPSEISNTGILAMTDPIYSAVMQAFSSEKKAKSIVKGTNLWSYNAKKLSASSDKKAESKKLVKLYSILGSRECSELMDVKAESGRTKEQIIHEILEKRYVTL